MPQWLQKPVPTWAVGMMLLQPLITLLWEIVAIMSVPSRLLAKITSSSIAFLVVTVNVPYTTPRLANGFRLLSKWWTG